MVERGRVVAENAALLRCERTAFVARSDVSARDHGQYAEARSRGKAQLANPSSLVGARYNPDADAIELLFSGGASMSVPRAMVPGLEGASETTIAAIVVSRARDALSWPSLDLDIYMPGLVQRAFGRR